MSRRSAYTQELSTTQKCLSFSYISTGRSSQAVHIFYSAFCILIVYNNISVYIDSQQDRLRRCEAQLFSVKHIYSGVVCTRSAKSRKTQAQA